MPLTAGELAQRADLIDDVVDKLTRRAGYSPAAEALQVSVAGMGADPYSVFDGQPNGLVHEIRVAGMEARRDVGRTD